MTTAASASKYEWFEPVTKFELREEQHYNGGTHADKAGLPLLICVPGIDGSGLTAVAQFAELSQQFELRCLSFDHADRSTFDDIRKAVTMQVKQAKSEGRTVFVLGESFGGIVGCGKVNSRLNEIQVPVLAVAGTSDLLLPSKEEAFRFSREIPQCKVNLVEGAGHAGVLDQRVDLTKIITGWIGSEMRTVATEKI
eukprot:jgi/Bigna1/130177/aug1.10_g4885